MITKFFNGRYFSNIILKKISKETFFCNFFFKKKLCLVIILIDNSFSSNLYVKNKIKSCLSTKIKFLIFKFSNNIKIKTLLNINFMLQFSHFVNGILIQLPIIKKLNNINVFNSISVKKDVDLLNPCNFGIYYSCLCNYLLPSIVMSLIYFLNKIKLIKKGLKCVMFGFSNIVGKPILLEFVNNGITVFIINKQDSDFFNIICFSDIIISGIGKRGFLNVNFITNGSLIIDIGINEYKHNIICGDVNLLNIIGKVSYITPSPGGIGPLTVVGLLSNLIKLNINKKFNI